MQEDITNENLEKHRQEVIRQGRRYRLPLIRTSRRIVGLTGLITLVVMFVFGIYIYVRLYQQQDHSNFVYQVTRLLPLPVARVGGDWVSYEEYLKELRRYIHYFDRQQNLDLEGPENEDQLADLKQRALQNVIDRAYVRQLAQRYSLKVSDDEVEAELEVLRKQNKLATGDSLENVLQTFWGWSLDDYRASLADEILRQKVIAKLDTRPQAQAQAVWERAQRGEDFAVLAQTYSEDLASAVNGGEYNFLLDLDEFNEHPKVLEAAFQTPVGEVSPIINTGYRLEIVKVLANEGDGKLRAAHISFVFAQLEDLRQSRYALPIKSYIDL